MEELVADMIKTNIKELAGRVEEAIKAASPELEEKESKVDAWTVARLNGWACIVDDIWNWNISKKSLFTVYT